MARSIEKWGTDTEKSPVANIIWGFMIFVLVVIVVTWFAQGSNFFLYKVFAPRQAAVERQVFEQTPSYVKGMVQDLDKMHLDYIKADSTQKQAIASIILHRADGFNLDNPDVPQDLRGFIMELRRQRGLTR